MITITRNRIGQVCCEYDQDYGVAAADADEGRRRPAAPPGDARVTPSTTQITFGPRESNGDTQLAELARRRVQSIAIVTFTSVMCIRLRLDHN